MKKRKLALILAASLTIMSVSQQQIQAAAWKKDNTGWWYQEDNGTYTKSKWKKIGSEWYWFDTNGYMAVGWKKINNSWYYFKSDGAMLGKGWHKIGSSYYYMYDTGAMAQNTWIGNEYVDANGVWIQGKTKYVQGWKKSGTRWWYCHKDGSYTKSGWEKINGKYYYFDASGYMLTGWKKANGVWYYLKSDGAMMNSGWLKIKGQWYYFREDGSMMGAGWHKIKEQWYYLNEDGSMAHDTWVGNYYISEDGQWKNSVERIKFVPSKMKNYATITAYTKNGLIAWEYKTPHYKEMDASQVCEIGRKNDKYFLVEGRSVIALNAQTGQVLWRNSDFGAHNAASAMGENAIYLCSATSPDFYAISFSGKTLKTIKSLNSHYYGAYKIVIQNGKAAVYLSGSDTSGYLGNKPKIFYVNLENYRYWMAN